MVAFVSENFPGVPWREAKALESDGGCPLTLVLLWGAPSREGLEEEFCVEVEDDLDDELTLVLVGGAPSREGLEEEVCVEVEDDLDDELDEEH